MNKFFTNYKKSWEEQLSAARSELQKENERLQSENARYREALEHYALLTEPYCSMNLVALNALKGGE